MTADDYIRLYVRTYMVPFAKVVVSTAKTNVHYALKPDQEVPDDDDKNTIFIRIEEQ